MGQPQKERIYRKPLESRECWGLSKFIGFLVYDSMNVRLREIAEIEGAGVSTIIRAAIEQFIEEYGAVGMEEMRNRKLVRKPKPQRMAYD